MASGLLCPPEHYLLKSAGGAGGFYYPGLVAIGEDDVTKLAGRIWKKYFAFAGVGCAYTPAQVEWAVVDYLIAHELGHARQREQRLRFSALEAENDADMAAGRSAAKLRLDLLLGLYVAEALGCMDGMACTHGTPETRQAAFFLGVQHQRDEDAMRRRP